MLKFLREKMKLVIIIISVVFIGTIFYGLGASTLSGKAGDDQAKALEIGKVNGKKIDPFQYEQIIQRIVSRYPFMVDPKQMIYIQYMALQQSVEFNILLNAAKGKVRVSGTEVDQAVKDILRASQIPSEKQLKEILKSRGISYDQFKNTIKNDILVQKLIQKIRFEVKVEPKDLKEIRASHILIRPLPSTASNEAKRKQEEAQNDKAAFEKANEVMARIKKGEDFGKLARTYSNDPGSKTKAGDLGFFSTGMMVKPFEDAAFELKVGEVSGVVKSDFGYHIIKATDFKLKETKDKSKSLEQAVLAEKQENAFRRWFIEEQKKAKVEITNPFLKAYDYRAQGQFKEAFDEYAKAARIFPQNYMIPLAQGDMYEMFEDYNQALSYYIKSKDLSPSNPYSYITIAETYIKLQQKAPAKRSEYQKLAIDNLNQGSLMAGDNKFVRGKLKELYIKLGASALAQKEAVAIKKIEAKEKAAQPIKP